MLRSTTASLITKRRMLHRCTLHKGNLHTKTLNAWFLQLVQFSRCSSARLCALLTAFAQFAARAALQSHRIFAAGLLLKLLLSFLWLPKRCVRLDAGTKLRVGLFSRQCSGKRRIPDLKTLTCETRAWNRSANPHPLEVWKFGRKDARRKLRYTELGGAGSARLVGSRSATALGVRGIAKLHAHQCAQLLHAFAEGHFRSP